MTVPQIMEHAKKEIVCNHKNRDNLYLGYGIISKICMEKQDLELCVGYVTLCVWSVQPRC